MSELFESCLLIIVGDPQLHARWLNTFSLLEYIGFRKIIKSQAVESMCLETLSHAVEEGRHALRLKRLAIKVGGARFDRYEPATLLCESEAESYFQKLDRYCESFFSDLSESEGTRLTYLYVTWLVEVRALGVYGLYQNALRANGLPLVLRGLLEEEEGHLQSVESELKNADPRFADRARELRKVEKDLYHVYLQALTKQLLPERADDNAARN